jgi:hypothetical protein
MFSFLKFSSKRGPKSLHRYEIHEDVLPQIFDLTLDPDRPLLVVDADEVLVEFNQHLRRFCAQVGYEMNLISYRLQGNIHHMKTGKPASEAMIRRLIEEFFQRETLRQSPIEGAAQSLKLLSRQAQILVLSNIPLPSRHLREDNLKALGMDYPLVANLGGKGRILRYLWDHTNAAVAFVDDTPAQHESAARRASGVVRIQYNADPKLRKLSGQSPHAQYWPETWKETTAILHNVLR